MFVKTCIEKWAQTNDAEDESDSKGGSHLLGDAPVPLLVLLQGVDPIIPILVWEVHIQILENMDKLYEDIRSILKLL